MVCSFFGNAYLYAPVQTIYLPPKPLASFIVLAYKDTKYSRQNAMDDANSRRKTLKRRGRPPLPKEEGKRFALALRVTGPMRRALEEAANSSGRSISQEIELRLEQTFSNEKVFGGDAMLGLLQMLAGAAAMVEARQGGKRWTSDWDTYQAVRRAWETIIQSLTPRTPPKLLATALSHPGPSPKRPTQRKEAFGGALFALGTDALENERYLKELREWREKAKLYAAEMAEQEKHIAELKDIGREAANELLTASNASPKNQDPD